MARGLSLSWLSKKREAKDDLAQTAWWFGCHVLFSHILGISSSQLTFIFFRGVAQPPTSKTPIETRAGPRPKVVAHWAPSQLGCQGESATFRPPGTNTEEMGTHPESPSFIWDWNGKQRWFYGKPMGFVRFCNHVLSSSQSAKLPQGQLEIETEELGMGQTTDDIVT